MRIAKSERTVTCIVFPKDVQELDAIETPKHAHDTIARESSVRHCGMLSLAFAPRA
jgi:hypothetical protein